MLGDKELQLLMEGKGVNTGQKFSLHINRGNGKINFCQSEKDQRDTGFGLFRNPAQ